MSERDLFHVLETSPLLADSPSTYKKPSERVFKPSYWFAIAAVVVAGIRIGSTAILAIPFLQELFCDRGIPKGLYPVHNSTDNTASSNVFWGQIVEDMRDMPNNDDGHCNSAEFNAALARFFTISRVLVAITVTLTVRYWSGLSDRIGRKRTIQLCNFGALISQLLYVVVRKNKGVSLYYIWVADLIEGLAGSPYTTIASAYAVDVTSPDERTVVLGRLSAGDMIGFTFGVAIGGLAAKLFGLEFVFVWLAPAFDLLNILYIFWMPESLTEAELHINRIKHSEPTLVQFHQPRYPHPRSLKRTWTNVLESCEIRLKAFIKGFAPEQLPNRLPGRNGFVFIILIVCINDISDQFIGSQLFAYLLYVLHWKDTDFSFFGIVAGLASFLALTLLLPFVRRFAPQEVHTDTLVSINFDIKVAVIALMFGSIGNLIFVFKTTWSVYLSLLVGSPFAMLKPSLHSIVSQSFPPEQIGETFGTLSMITKIVSIVIPLPASWIYGATLEILPTALFFLSAALGAVAVVLSFLFYIKQTRLIPNRT